MLVVVLYCILVVLDAHICMRWISFPSISANFISFSFAPSFLEPIHLEYVVLRTISLALSILSFVPSTKHNLQFHFCLIDKIALKRNRETFWFSFNVPIHTAQHSHTSSSSSSSCIRLEDRVSFNRIYTVCTVYVYSV